MSALDRSGLVTSTLWGKFQALALQEKTREMENRDSFLFRCRRMDRVQRMVFSEQGKLICICKCDY